MGMICIALGIFCMWVMQNGQTFITSDNWTVAVAQVVSAFGGWLGGKGISAAPAAGTLGGSGGSF